MSEEISLSVEETNSLRAKLGLKPLRIESTSEESREKLGDHATTSIQASSKNDDDRDEGKRLISEITSGGGVLDVLGDFSSTTDWLSKHKKRLKANEADTTSHKDSESSSEENDEDDSEGESSDSVESNSD